MYFLLLNGKHCCLMNLMTVGSVFYTVPFCYSLNYLVSNSRRFVIYLKLIEFASFKSLSPRHIYKRCFFLWQTGICIQNLAFWIVFCMYFAITFFLISVLLCLIWLHRRVRYPLDRLIDWLDFNPLSKSVEKKKQILSDLTLTNISL